MLHDLFIYMFGNEQQRSCLASIPPRAGSYFVYLRQMVNLDRFYAINRGKVYCVKNDS